MKYVFTDLDGTLLSSDGLKQNTIDACLQFQKSNKLILASGRNEASVKKIISLLQLKENQGACILANGMIFIDYQDDERKVVPSFSKQEAQKITRLAYLLFFRIYLVTEDTRYSYHVLYEYLFYIARWLIKHKPIPKLERVKQFPDGVIKIELCPTIFFQQFLKLFKRIYQDRYEVVNVSKYWVEVLPKGINKANMVQYYIEKYQINKDNVYVFGDGENDISMFELTNHSYAMDNAEEHVKKRANYITDSNNQDGVIKIINQIEGGKE